MSWSPNSRYRYSLGPGMSGWDVWALQVALNNNNVHPSKITEDGSFGTQTQSVVKELQTWLGTTPDGIAGPQTQSELCMYQCSHAEIGLTPLHLVKGICLGESGGIVPATSGLYPNGSRDYGPFQDNKLNPSQTDLHVAFSLNNESAKLAKGLNAAYSHFKQETPATAVETLWKLAVLNYNWPAAADQIAKGRGSTWVYTSAGKEYRLSDPAPWVEAIGVPGVTTGQQWCDYYVASKIVYVTNWTIVPSAAIEVFHEVGKE